MEYLEDIKPFTDDEIKELKEKFNVEVLRSTYKGKIPNLNEKYNEDKDVVLLYEHIRNWLENMRIINYGTNIGKDINDIEDKIGSEKQKLKIKIMKLSKFRGNEMSIIINYLSIIGYINILN